MHEHEHENKAYRVEFVYWGMSLVLMICALFINNGFFKITFNVIAYVLAGYNVLKEAAENILKGEIFDENFLMAVASIGAFCIGEYAEAIGVMLLYNVGEYLQDKAVDASRDSISKVLSIRSNDANLIENGLAKPVPANTVPIDSLIVVKPGEKIPLDGIVVEGSSSVDTSPLTGESLPVDIAPDSEVLAGCVNLNGLIKVRVTKLFDDTSVSKILKTIEEADNNKSAPEKFITKFAKIYTPVVCGLALLIAIVPPILGLGTWPNFIHKALSFLVISCPCALVISIPLTFFAGIGKCGKNGILVKGSNHLEALSKVEVAAFDKTGTLTKGSFSVKEVVSFDGNTDKLLQIAALTESHSNHPLAKAIVDYYNQDLDLSKVSNLSEIAGKGIEATIEGETVRVGTADFVGHLEEIEQKVTAVFVSQNNECVGYIVLGDEVRAEAGVVMKKLKRLGIQSITMLTGDKKEIAESVGEELRLDAVYSQLLPENKVERFKLLAKDKISMFVGDGINDAPVLALANVGLSMGALGSDAAIETSDIVIMSDDLEKVSQSVEIGKKTVSVAKQNIVLSLAIKVIIMILSMVFTMPLWLAVFADVGVCLIAILNSLRVYR